MNKIRLILSQQRTGSTYLFLHFHDRIQHVCYEPYNSDNVRAEYESLQQELAYRNRLSEPIAYLRFLNERGPIDMKLEITPANVLSAVYANPGAFSVVLLSRCNKLQQYISYLTAGRSKVFHKDSPAMEAPLKIDCNQFDAHVKKMPGIENRAREAFPEALCVDYEDIDSRIGEISRLFGVEAKFNGNTVRLHSDYAFVTNREELNQRYPEWKI